MKRIIIEYSKSPTIVKDNKTREMSVLRVLIDIKGYTRRPLVKVFGKEADIMYELLQYVDWDKANKNGLMKYMEEKTNTKVKNQEYKRFINLIYGLKDAKEFGFETW